jgi:hypothetical protein
MFALACTSPTKPLFGIDATVRFVPLEGGCWSIVTSGHTVYEPIDLPSSFRVDGLAVRVVLRDAPDWGSICMIGPLVHVDAISVR